MEPETLYNRLTGFILELAAQLRTAERNSDDVKHASTVYWKLRSCALQTLAKSVCNSCSYA